LYHKEKDMTAISVDTFISKSHFVYQSKGERTYERAKEM
jgi:hypothetical protein